MSTFYSLLLLFLLYSAVLVAAQTSTAPKNSTTPWKTLSGNAPLVIARGGFSGLLPDSSSGAYSFALSTSLTDVILWCDVQLTKDGVGICFPYLNLENSSDIASLYQNTSKVYPVNGVPTPGWFSLDYTLDNLSNVYLYQGIYSRPNKFDGLFNLSTVENVALQLQPPGLWLNIQHDAFYRLHNLSMRTYVLSISRRVIVNYVSSPEVDFLRSIVTRLKGSKTKLVFRFLEADDTEPSTNQTYGSLLKNLTFVKTFASGILVPKSYIWPVSSNGYLQPYTSVVSDAHRAGLEIFASDFSNDNIFSYNYSYDPINEYLSFIDNGDFSVDGFLTDFPLTPSAAIDCFSHINKSIPRQVAGGPFVISHNGASGFYPGSTNLAYQQAVEDGADFIDCSVQMTMDGTPICLGSINLIEGTTVAQSEYSSRAIKIPEIQKNAGIFAFNLTWKEILYLKPSILNPFLDYTMFRNPASKTAGVFMSLADFLAFAKSKPLSGVLISIEHAPYLAEKEGLGVIDAVLNALKDSGYNNLTTQSVIIQSTDSSVLKVFKEKTNYKRMYKIDEPIRDALNSSIEDITQFADSVTVTKYSVFPDSQAYLTGSTNVVQRLQSFNISVYVHLFRNEFVDQAWDFFSDATVEINSFVKGAGINGLITDFPGTAAAYKSNRCLKMGANTPAYMAPVQPGSLMQLIPLQILPPAEAPSPVLSDVVEPPIPPVSKNANAPGPTTSSSQPPPPPPSSSAQTRHIISMFHSSLIMVLGYLLLF